VDENIPSMAMSEFARGRHVVGGKHTWFSGSEEELLDLVREFWDRRQPGAGRGDLTQVVVVPVPPTGFTGTTIEVTETTELLAAFERRQDHEDPYIQVSAIGLVDAPRHASVVLYSAATLSENDGQRSSDADWEVVCLLAGPVAEEPMDPLTMARNFLEKPGGTFAPYTAHEFAESIYYWSRRARRHVPEPTEETS